MKIRHGILAFLFLSLLFIPSVLYSYNAPDPVRTFYGDATGDMSVAGDDLSAHRTVASGGSATYATTQPQTGGQYWNTCDLSGDGSCAGDDIPSLIGVASGGTTSYSLSGWAISNYDLNESGNTATISYPFRLNVATATMGRPGVIIKVTIESDSTTTGSLVGRTCTPGSDPDELNTADDQCAVAVTVTDFYGDSSVGPTESGTTGLQIQADGAGTIHLLAEVIVQTGLLLPAMTLDLYPEFLPIGGNTAPVNNAPATVSGNETPNSIGFSTSPTDAEQGAASLTSSVVSATGACTGGSMTAAGRWTFTFPESVGPTSCDVVSRVYDGYLYSDELTTHVIAQEYNVAPVDNAADSVSGNELEGVAFYINPTDNDVPEQTLTCSEVSNGCAGGALVGCAWSWTPSEADGPTSCDVVTRVYDGVAYSANKTTRVIVNEVNVAPVDNAPAVTTGDELTEISFDVNPTDADIPPQTLTCSQVSNSCAGGELVGCAWSWTPTEADGPTSCDVETRVYDGIVYSPSWITHVVVEEVNDLPVDNAPANASGNELTEISFSVSPTDSDVPVQGLVCSVVSATGACASGLMASCNWSWTPTEADGPTSCDVVTRVFDGVDYSANKTTHITVNEVNQSPTWTTEPQDMTVDTAQIYNQTNGVAADADLPNSGAGNPGYLQCSSSGNTCSFSITVSGVGAGAANCNMSFTAGASTETCQVTVTASDGWSPAGTVSKVVNITVNNQPVAINCSSPGPNPVNEGSAMQCAVTSGGGTPTVDTAVDTCGGSVNGSGPWTYDFTPTEAQGPDTCKAAVKYASQTANQVVTVNEVNQTPTWTTAPTNLTVPLSLTYSGINGYAADADLPNVGASDPGYLTCTRISNTCSFSVTVSGSGAGTVGCATSFTTGASTETCSVNYQVSDGYSVTITKSVTIAVKRVVFVDDITTGANNGTSWANAYRTIQAGVNGASSGNLVWVAQGTYATGSSTPVLAMRSDMEVYGGFYGDEGCLEERLDPSAFPAILDGQTLSSPVVEGASNARFDGFTVRNGNGGTAGGMRNLNVSNLIIVNNIFSGNSASNYAGGGMYNEGSSPTITHCTFSGNSSGMYGGGGINNIKSSSPAITNCIFLGNSSGDYGGGGIGNSQTSSPSIINCTFSGNSVTGTYSGRGIGNFSSSSPTITNVIMWGDTGGSRPEIANTSASATVTYSDIQMPSGTYTGTGNINSDPLFVAGTYGNYYLSQVAAGQASNSPCLNAGSNTAAYFGLNTRTTRTDNVADSGTVDMGFHYVIP